MSDIKSAFQAIALAVQQQLAQQYPADKAPSIFVSIPKIAAKVETEMLPNNQYSSHKSDLNNL